MQSPGGIIKRYGPEDVRTMQKDLAKVTGGAFSGVRQDLEKPRPQASVSAPAHSGSIAAWPPATRPAPPGAAPVVPPSKLTPGERLAFEESKVPKVPPKFETPKPKGEEEDILFLLGEDSGPVASKSQASPVETKKAEEKPLVSAIPQRPSAPPIPPRPIMAPQPPKPAIPQPSVSAPKPPLFPSVGGLSKPAMPSPPPLSIPKPPSPLPVPPKPMAAPPPPPVRIPRPGTSAPSEDILKAALEAKPKPPLSARKPEPNKRVIMGVFAVLVASLAIAGLGYWFLVANKAPQKEPSPPPPPQVQEPLPPAPIIPVDGNPVVIEGENIEQLKAAYQDFVANPTPTQGLAQIVLKLTQENTVPYATLGQTLETIGLDLPEEISQNLDTASYTLWLFSSGEGSRPGIVVEVKDAAQLQQAILRWSEPGFSEDVGEFIRIVNPAVTVRSIEFSINYRGDTAIYYKNYSGPGLSFDTGIWQNQIFFIGTSRESAWALIDRLSASAL